MTCNYFHVCLRRIFIVLLAAMVCACSSLSPQQKEAIGTTTGAVLGGIVGSQIGNGAGKTIATVVGVGVGAFLGNQLAKYLDREQQKQVNSIVNQQLDGPEKSSSHYTWNSDDQSKSVAIQTSKGFDRSQLDKVAKTKKVDVDSEQIAQLPSNAICRYNTNRISVHQQPQAEQGTLYCRTNQGNWIPVGARTVVAAR